MTYTYAELFAGAGGLSLGLDAAGFHAAAHAEIEPHARAVLRYRWPDTRLDGDVTKINGADYAGITLLSGGSPCQDLSVAGNRAGLTGSRSSLFHEQVRIWRESNAPYLFWENVGGALSSNHGADFATVLSTIVGSTVAVPADGWRGGGGVVAGRDAVAAWRVLDLQYFGPPQRRVRVFILAARAGGVDPAEVLALQEGVCGHYSPRKRPRENIARGAAGGARAGSVMAFKAGQSETLQSGSNGSTQVSAVIAWDNELNASTEVHGPLMSNGKSANNKAGVLAWDSELNASTEVHGPLMNRGKSGSDCNGVLAFHHTQDRISGEVSPANVVCITGAVTHALMHEGADASEDGTGRGTPIVMNTIPASYAKGGGHNRDELLVVANQQANAGIGYGIVPTLSVASDPPYLGTGRPRRLTPLECERLMSWPDQWTATGRKDDGTEYALSDTARYRLCGNGVGSVCAEWIARRLHDAITAAATA